MKKITMTLTLQEYQQKAMETCMDTSRNVAYMIFNLIGEVGEAAEKIVADNDYLADSNIIIHDLDNFAALANKYGAVAKKIRKDSGLKLQFDAEDLEWSRERMKSEVREELAKELGDILWQLSGLCSVLGYELEDIAQLNLDKLASRKQRGKIDGDGDNR